jgi:hypothetical protein
MPTSALSRSRPWPCARDEIHRDLPLPATHDDTCLVAAAGPIAHGHVLAARDEGGAGAEGGWAARPGLPVGLLRHALPHDTQVQCLLCRHMLLLLLPHAAAIADLTP